jgi:hypothetical protein
MEMEMVTVQVFPRRRRRFAIKTRLKQALIQ